MNVKKTVATAAVTVAAVTGAVTSTAFDSPLDLVPEVAEELEPGFVPKLSFGTSEEIAEGLRTGAKNRLLEEKKDEA